MADKFIDRWLSKLQLKRKDKVETKKGDVTILPKSVIFPKFKTQEDVALLNRARRRHLAKKISRQTKKGNSLKCAWIARMRSKGGTKKNHDLDKKERARRDVERDARRLSHGFAPLKRS